MPETNQNEFLREEFNRWAHGGKGEGMEHDHLPIALPVLQKMHVTPNDNILDVGCGSGWLSVRLANMAPNGRVVGMDVSDEMVRVARRASAHQHNVLYVTGEVGQIPWESNFFHHAISVESAYYWPDPAVGVNEIVRVLRPGGSSWILINYYRDNPHCHQWGPLLAVPTKLLSAQEWSNLFRSAGCSQVFDECIPDPSPSPETYTGRWFRDAAQLRAFKAKGALLVHAIKA